MSDIETALAPIEALAEPEGVEAALYRDSGLRVDLIDQVAVAVASTVQIALAESRALIAQQQPEPTPPAPDDLRERVIEALRANCPNCDGRLCMGCVFREYDHDCGENCPDCCDPESRFMGRVSLMADDVLTALEVETVFSVAYDDPHPHMDSPAPRAQASAETKHLDVARRQLAVFTSRGRPERNVRIESRMVTPWARVEEAIND